MVRLIPEAPTFTTTSEREVWERLRDSLGADDVLMANLRLTDEAKDHEIDLVVLMPDVGVMVLEVKGGSVRYDDGWWIKRGAAESRIHPVDQARDAKHSLRQYVEQRWSRQPVAWGHGVVVPYAHFPQDFEVPELLRWALHDKDDQADLAERIRQNGKRLSHGRRAPTYDDVEAIVALLNGPPTQHDVVAESDEREAVADRLTQEQAMILSVTRLIPRVEVRGGAGSGKTVLALQQAKQLTRGHKEVAAQRVALLCYSLGLAEYFKRETSRWDRKERPAFVGTFHDFGVQWGAPAEGDRSDPTFWEEDLPRLMDALATQLPDGQRYDAIIVDEAQDFADLWWRPVVKALRDEEKGGLYVYSDENQRIFERFGRPPVDLVPLVLDHNLRNTKQIHESFGSMAPSRMYSRGGDGTPVRFIATRADEAVGAADDEVDRLIDAGWPPGHICLLTTGHRHPLQQERTDFHGQDGYWKTFWDEEDVFYGHVLGCKGLERRAVVLCVNEHEIRDRSRERLYVGMSRATDELVVVGDPDHLRAVGGSDVARRLGL